MSRGPQYDDEHSPEVNKGDGGGWVLRPSSDRWVPREMGVRTRWRLLRGPRGGSRDVAEQFPRLSRPPDQQPMPHIPMHTRGGVAKMTLNLWQEQCADVGAQMSFLPPSAVQALAGMEASQRKVHGFISSVGSRLLGGMLFQKLRSKDKSPPHTQTHAKEVGNCRGLTPASS